MFYAGENVIGIDDFIEPKGDVFIANDKWKEDFLLQLEEMAIPTITYIDDNRYKIWGLHFFNRNTRIPEFDRDIKRLL